MAPSRRDTDGNKADVFNGWLNHCCLAVLAACCQDWVCQRLPIWLALISVEHAFSTELVQMHTAHLLARLQGFSKQCKLVNMHFTASLQSL